MDKNTLEEMLPGNTFFELLIEDNERVQGTAGAFVIGYRKPNEHLWADIDELSDDTLRKLVTYRQGAFLLRGYDSIEEVIDLACARGYMRGIIVPDSLERNRREWIITVAIPE